MKNYNIKRNMVFQISSYFDDGTGNEFTWSYLGTIFASAFISDDLAAKILDKFPGSISPIVT